MKQLNLKQIRSTTSHQMNKTTTDLTNLSANIIFCNNTRPCQLLLQNDQTNDSTGNPGLGIRSKTPCLKFDP